MADVEYKLVGVQSLARQLKRMQGKQAKSITRRATKAGAWVVAKQYRRNIRNTVRRRNTSDRIGGRAGSLFDARATSPKVDKKFRRSGKQGAGYIVLPGAKGGYGYWGRVLEMGDPGRGMPARPMLRPAFDSTKDKLGGEIIKNFWSGINKLARKR